LKGKSLFGLKGKALVIVGVIILAIMLSTSFVAGAVLTEQEASGTFTVIDYVPEITLYADAGGTTPLGSDIMDFGSNLHRGESSSYTIYVANTGEVDFTGVSVSTTLGTSIGTLSYALESPGLAVGEIKALTITITIVSTAGFETYTPIFAVKAIG